MIIRGTFTVKGMVQNANYRETVLRIALGAGLKGFVRNQDDVTVRVVAEGDQETVRTLPARLRTRSGRVSVEKVLARYSRATGEFKSFVIDYGPDVTRGDLALIEKLDEGYHIMLEMSARLDQTNRSIQGMDDHLSGDIVGVGRSVASVGSDVKDMNLNMGNHFNRLDRKYDSFGRTLKTVSKDMKGMNSSLKTVSKDMKGMNSSLKTVSKDMKGMNSSLKTVSKDIKGLKSSGAGMASDMKGMASDMKGMKSSIAAFDPRAPCTCTRPG